MVLEARRLVDEGIGDSDAQALNALGYDEAAQHVYGMTYDTWKERHQAKATPEQLERYQASEALQAKHDKHLLAVRGEKPAATVISAHGAPTEGASTKEAPTTTTVSTASASSTLASNVCCQDVDEVVAATTPLLAVVAAAEPTRVNADARTLPSAFQPPRIPELSAFANHQFPVTAVLTVSDRAFTGMYETGDLSGPAVVAAVKAILAGATTAAGCLQQNNNNKSYADDLDFVTVIVPDDSAAIQAKLKTLADQGVDLILTTGGTGFSPRDVTPEATAEAVDYELTSLMAFVMTACSEQQPLQTLSRGTAGILNSTVVANLPGNPAAVGQILPVLLPLLLHAVSDLHHVTPEILHIG